LIIGDNALFLDPAAVRLKPDPTHPGGVRLQPDVQKIDLGEAWTGLTGLPFVYAFWAGRADALAAGDVDALQRARDQGVKRPDELARQYLADRPDRHAIGARYLRDNIQYYLGEEERAGLELFYRYAAEAGAVPRAMPLLFY
jgi:chorismate dehydratase